MPHCTTGYSGDCSLWSPALRPLAGGAALPGLCHWHAKLWKHRFRAKRHSVAAGDPCSSPVAGAWWAKCCRPVRIFWSWLRTSARRVPIGHRRVRCPELLASGEIPCRAQGERKRGVRAAGLRHPATRLAALPDRRTGKPVLHALHRASDDFRCRRWPRPDVHAGRPDDLRRLDPRFSPDRCPGFGRRILRFP